MLQDIAAFETARSMMVDSQVRPNKVNDPRIVAAMRRIARERFVPASCVALAYADEDVPLGHGRFLLEPMAIGRLIQAAGVRPGERALVVASGTGYGAAVLAACGAAVTALEEDAGLLARARAALASEAPEVALVSGPIAAGWSAGAPYDLILIEGGVEVLPEAIAGQVQAPPGRLVMVRAGAGRVGHAVLGQRSGASLVFHEIFDCATAPLPQFRRAAAFVF